MTENRSQSETYVHAVPEVGGSRDKVASDTINLYKVDRFPEHDRFSPRARRTVFNTISASSRRETYVDPHSFGISLSGGVLSYSDRTNSRESTGIRP